MNKPKNSAYDIIIIGGGMVGASLACALAEQVDKKIAVIEAHAFESDSQPSFDDRVLAFNYGARRIWEAMGLWSQLAEVAEPIKSIHVSDRGHFGATRIHADEEHVPALGYVVDNRSSGKILMQRIEQLAHIDWLCPASLKSLQQDECSVQIEIEHQGNIQSLSCRLLIAADGAQSKTRQLCGLQSLHQDYGQAAIITNVETEYPHQGVAYERFTDSGPLAFLPMTKKRSSVVWTVDVHAMDQILELDNDAFTEALQQRFGYRLGRIIKTGRRHAYPLVYRETEQLVKGRVAMIGNAAHSLHPVSGQGYNLALRDVAEMAELIASHDDPGHPLLLAEYHAKRYQDMRRVYRLTDSLVKIFSNRSFTLGHARASALIMLDMMPTLRHLLARQSMGLLGRMNKMMRGLPL